MVTSQVTSEVSARTGSPAFAARHIVTVLESDGVGASFHRLRLACPAIALAARPGQFVHVLPGALTSADPLCETAPIAFGPLLRRAFSIMSTSSAAAASRAHQIAEHEAAGQERERATEEEAWFDILFRVGGQGTSLLARSRVGDLLDVLGPLGNGFALEDAGETAHTDALSVPQRPVLLVGGGIGVPPLIFAAQELRRMGVSRETESSPSQQVEVFVGARTLMELVGVEELRQAQALVHISTDDGSQGQQGLVTQPLRQRLQEMLSGASVLREPPAVPEPSEPRFASSSKGTARALSAVSALSPLVCACGPWPMLRAVASLCAQLGVECRVSLEENMPCGVGVCNGCVVPMLNAPDDYGKFQRICVHGPVLDARTVDWDDSIVHPSSPMSPALIQGAPAAPEQKGASQ